MNALEILNKNNEFCQQFVDKILQCTKQEHYETISRDNGRSKTIKTVKYVLPINHLPYKCVQELMQESLIKEIKDIQLDERVDENELWKFMKEKKLIDYKEINLNIFLISFAMIITGNGLTNGVIILTIIGILINLTVIIINILNKYNRKKNKFYKLSDKSLILYNNFKQLIGFIESYNNSEIYNSWYVKYKFCNGKEV